MAVPTLYGFLTDEALRQTTKVDTTGLSDQGYGILTGEPGNYFVKRATLGDTRRNRLQILDSQTPFGSLTFLFDSNRFDTSLLEAMTDIESSVLFNVLERIYLQQEYTDPNLEYQLTNNNMFSGYVPGSFMHSINEGQAKVTSTTKQVKLVTFKDWYSFEFETATVKFRVHFWVSSKGFARDYPYTTITSVVPPYDPTVLVNPAALLQSASMQILTEGSSYIFTQSNAEALARDQNGVYTYRTKYVIDGTKTLLLPFALPYCGARVPSSLECRKAIREFLEKNTSAKQAELELLFPELYVNARFFIVPLWDMFSPMTDRTVYNSIFSLPKVIEKSRLIFSSYSADFREEYMELLLNAQNKILSITLPDQLNDQLFSILKQHPTYQDYSSQVPGFRYMEATTQEFSGKLTRCFAILVGESLSSEFIKTELGGFTYLSFTAGKSEYLVMDKDSYMAYMNNL